MAVVGSGKFLEIGGGGCGMVWYVFGVWLQWMKLKLEFFTVLCLHT